MTRRRTRSEPARKLPTGGRLWAIRGMLVLLGFALVAAIEGSLRLAGVAAPEPLVLRVRQGPLDVHQINPRIGLNYFPPEMARIMPEPGFQIFPAAKTSGTFRIFVLGESTTAGFPYHTNGSLSAFLQSHLEARWPTLHAEVINCGLTALSSYAVVDFVRDLKEFEPDLFVVYAGHNEFYGALGPASAVAFGKSRPVAAILRWTMDLRISRLMNQALRRSKQPAAVQDKTLMEAMVGRTGIRPGDATYRAAMRAYESNLEDLLSAAGETPVVLCDLVCNLRDQPPFGPVSRSDLTPDEAARVSAARKELGTSMAEGFAAANSVPPNRERTLTAVRAAVAIDSMDAALRFDWARACEADGDPRTAAREYRAARDLDGIPFRAPSDINRIVRKVARDRAIHVPLEMVFDSLAAGAAPGLDLFVEHVHPRLLATDAMAKSILHSVSDRGLLPRAAAGADTVSWEVLAARQGVTELDEEIAERRIFHLVNRWPYPENATARFASTRDRVVQEIAEDVLADRLDLAAAHVALAERRLAAGSREAAFRELRSACLIFPVVPGRFANAGRLALELGHVDVALELLERATHLDPANAEYPKWIARARSMGSAETVE